jgi:hypothetical protein
MGCGAASGFVTGALVGAIGAVRYNIDDEFAWNSVDEKVLEYGNDNNRLADAAKYVSSGDYEVSFDDLAKTQYNPLEGKQGTVNFNSSDYIINGKFDAERFYYAAYHEGGHNDMLNSAFQNKRISEIGNSMNEWALSTSNFRYDQHRYAQEFLLTDQSRIPRFNNWSEQTTNFINDLHKKALENDYKSMLFDYISWGY